MVGLDTSPIIYFVEENQTYLNTVSAFFEALEEEEFRAVTSTITLLEVLVHPSRKGESELARKYRDILTNSRSISTLPLSAVISEEAAQLRARHNFRTPDAIQLATATASGASFFLTNDGRMPSFDGIKVLILDELQNG